MADKVEELPITGRRLVPLETKHRYFIDTQGVVYKGELALKPYVNLSNHTKKEYRRVKLAMKSGGRQAFYIHRLVAYAFLDLGSREHLNVLHLNDCSTDNRLVNLKLGTQSENLKQHHDNKRSVPDAPF